MPLGVLNGTAGNDLIHNRYTDAEGETADSIYMPNGPDAPWSAVVWDAGAGNDTILGHYYETYTVYAGDGDDRANLFNGTTYGGSGNDTLTVERGFGEETILHGDAGNDRLIAGAGRDQMFGGSGNDWLGYDDMSGDNIAFMTGGSGADVFDLSMQSHDTSRYGTQLAGVQDFTPREDVLAIGGCIVTREMVAGGFAEFDGTARIIQRGDHVLIAWSEPNQGDGGRYGAAIMQLIETNLADLLAHLPREGVVEGSSLADRITRDFADRNGDRTSDASSLIQSGKGNDLVLAYAGNDTIEGGNGHDTIEGMSGRNLILGGAGDDLLKTGVHRSTLEGGSGQDHLMADLRKGAAHLLTGGSGADTFEFTGQRPTQAARVTLTDFNPDEDRLVIGGSTVDFTALAPGQSLSESADGTALLRFDGQTLILSGLHLDDLI